MPITGSKVVGHNRGNKEVSIENVVDLIVTQAPESVPMVVNAIECMGFLDCPESEGASRRLRRRRLIGFLIEFVACSFPSRQSLILPGVQAGSKAPERKRERERAGERVLFF